MPGKFLSINSPACSTKIELLPKVDHLNNIRTHRCTADPRKAPKTVPRYLVQKMEISGADCKNYSRLEVSDDAYLKTCKYLHVGEGTSQCCNLVIVPKKPNPTTAADSIDGGK